MSDGMLVDVTSPVDRRRRGHVGGQRSGRRRRRRRRRRGDELWSEEDGADLDASGASVPGQRRSDLHRPHRLRRRRRLRRRLSVDGSFGEREGRGGGGGGGGKASAVPVRVARTRKATSNKQQPGGNRRRSKRMTRPRIKTLTNGRPGKRKGKGNEDEATSIARRWRTASIIMS